MATPEADQIPITNYHGHPAYIKSTPLPLYYRLEYVSDSADFDPDAPAENTAKKRDPKAATAAPEAPAMSEPRVRPARQQGQMSFGNEIRQMLHAYGDTTPHSDFSNEPNPETVRVLDEMVTDFIIESCHEAAQTAAHAGRQKVKAEDFHFALRMDPAKLGRVQELFKIERELKEARKAFNENDDDIAGLKEMEKKNVDKDGVAKEGEASTAAGEKNAGGEKKSKGKGKAKTASKKAGRR